MENQTNMEKLKNGTAIGYGIGAIGEGIGYNVFFSFFSFFGCESYFLLLLVQKFQSLVQRQFV